MADLVTLAGRRIRLDDLRAKPEQFARVLAAAKASDKHGYCLCRPAAPLRLVIRRRGDRYHLARWPGEGQNHDSGCPFHAVDADLSGRSAYADSAILEGPDGTSIRFDTPLTSGTTATAARADTGDRDGGNTGSGRRAVGLLGLLHFLWEDANLNCFEPAQRHRNWASVVTAITRQSSDITLSRHPLADVLFTVPAYRNGLGETNIAAFDAFLARLRSADGQSRRGLLLAELKSVEATRYGHAYVLAHLPRARRAYIDARLHTKVLRSYDTAFTQAATDAGGRRIALLLIEASPKGYAQVVDAAVMLTGHTYIPADSSHELVMDTALRRAGRAFLKPLRWDHTTLTLPDFVLTDTPTSTVIEVWGMDSTEYEQRKAAKIATYTHTGTRLIGWRPPEPLPDLTLSAPPTTGGARRPWEDR
ncbi:DUF1173 family protein [Nocardia sp. 2]|uniref:DUF1173 family protein n=1 Tax=Nocardia acididurans TaxID=2802282 RepID=A0ABS1MI52_9NOCA|nr:DUF1173 family protein [Nocardia acididurans]MBL1080297.1 DUF1173 family protein [Nocardia acididurans]